MVTLFLFFDDNFIKFFKTIDCLEKNASKLLLTKILFSNVGTLNYCKFDKHTKQRILIEFTNRQTASFFAECL